ncbi:MAG: hypothetical protein ACOVRN_18935 [Flavobacterium sp.]
MSVEYYLLSRKTYDHMIAHLEAILELQNTLDEHPDSKFGNPLDVTYYHEEIQRFIQLKDMCSRRIMELCEHDYIDDEIDVGPETSQKITYCQICEHSK